MPSLVTYNPAKETPRPRTGSRGFSTVDGAVMFDPNIPTPVDDNLLKQLQAIPDFAELVKSGGMTIATQPPIEAIASQPADRAFNLPVPETEAKAQVESEATKQTKQQQQQKAS